MEVEAVDEGKVGKLLVSEGTEGVKVNTPIAILLAEGESEASPSPRSRGEDQPKAQPPPVSASGAKAAPAAEAPAAAKSATGSPPHHAGGVSSTRRGEGLGVGETPTANLLRSPLPPPQGGRDKERRVPQRTGTAETASLPRRWRAGSPRMAGLILRRSPEAGPHGRIVKRDVETALKDGTGRAQPKPGTAVAAKAPSQGMLTPQAMPGRQDFRALREGLLRGCSARRHAPGHRPAPHAVEADHPALSPHRRLPASTSCCARASG